MEQSQIQGNNQQESLLWWLGGIIDGEGCITINHHRLHRGTLKETLLFSPAIIISNTNKILLDKCQEILRNNNLAFYVRYDPEKRNKKWKERGQIVIVGIKRCVRALNILSQYLIAKKEEADLVKKFCEERLRKSKEYKGNRKDLKTGRLLGGNAPYDEEDFKIILRVAEIHNRNPQRLYAEIRNYRLRNKI